MKIHVQSPAFKEEIGPSGKCLSSYCWEGEEQMVDVWPHEIRRLVCSNKNGNEPPNNSFLLGMPEEDEGRRELEHTFSKKTGALFELDINAPSNSSGSHTHEVFWDRISSP